MKYTRWIAVLLIICVAACSPAREGDAGEAAASSESTTPNATLTNTYWKLVGLNGAAPEPGEDKELHMILRGDDQVAGYAGCNQFTGAVTVSGDGLAFGPMASTWRMCAEVMAQENAFLQALENAHRFEISGEDLAIENGAGDVVMRFAAVYMQ